MKLVIFKVVIPGHLPYQILEPYKWFLSHSQFIFIMSPTEMSNNPWSCIGYQSRRERYSTTSKVCIFTSPIFGGGKNANFWSSTVGEIIKINWVYISRYYPSKRALKTDRLRQLQLTARLLWIQGKESEPRNYNHKSSDGNSIPNGQVKWQTRQA